MAGVLLAMCQKAVSGDISADEQNSDVSLTITKFQVNDQTLELTYKIRNDSDHDVWICDSVNINSNRLDYEAYVAKDAQTLVIRKRFDLPGGNVVLESNFTGRYIRLRPGQERADSLLVTLPPMTNRFFDAEIGKAKYTKRLALEIGYYDEDLRSLILKTVELADKLACDTNALTYEYDEIHTRYFPGLWIARYFNDKFSSYFRDSVNSGDDEILMPPMSWGDIHLDEKVLRLTIDGVYIRCWGEPPLSETVPAEVTTVLTKFDVNDTNLELGFKIINNSDHDVWICDRYVDKFMEADNRTLVLRTRYNLSKEGVMWEFPFPRFRYSRLRPGQEKVESYYLGFPVKPDALFKTSQGNAEYSKRLAVEIGFYDEDLPGLILDIAEMAELLSCDASLQSIASPPLDANNDRMELSRRFFAGVFIARFYNLESFTYFRDSVTAGGDEIIAPYLWQTLDGERVLHIEIDNVSIPYESNYPPLND